MKKTLRPKTFGTKGPRKIKKKKGLPRLYEKKKKLGLIKSLGFCFFQKAPIFASKKEYKLDWNLTGAKRPPKSTPLPK